jgi:hypothetical protein
MDPEDICQACSVDIHSSLEKLSGWHPIHCPIPDQTGTCLLGRDPMSAADGKPQITPLIDLQIDISGSDNVVLFLKPSTVRFRHSTIAAFSNPATLAEASKAAEGSLCRLLPTSTPAIIHKLRIASSQEAEKIEKEWARAGFALPPAFSSFSSFVVDVRFEEDEDAAVNPFPACAVLSYLGFDPVDTKLSSSGVAGALHRLQEDLKNAAYKLFGGGGLLIKEMRRWGDTPNSSNMKGEKSSILDTKGFQSAADMEAEAPAEVTSGPPAALKKLGEVIDLGSLQRDLGGGDGSGEDTAVTRIKKPHARAGPELLAYLARLEKEEAAEAAAAKLNNPQKKAVLPPSMALAAQAVQAAPLKKTPLLGAKRTLPTAAAAAAAAAKKTAKAPKRTATAAGAAAGSKPPAAPKAPKPAVEIDVAALDISGLAASGKLGTLTIPQLKAYCRSIKQPVGGKKGDLENRIKTHLGVTTEQ